MIYQFRFTFESSTTYLTAMGGLLFMNKLHMSMKAVSRGKRSGALRADVRFSVLMYSLHVTNQRRFLSSLVITHCTFIRFLIFMHYFLMYFHGLVCCKLLATGFAHESFSTSVFFCHVFDKFSFTYCREITKLTL